MNKCANVFLNVFLNIFQTEQSIAKLIVKIDNKELHIPKNLNPISKKTEEILR